MRRTVFTHCVAIGIALLAKGPLAATTASQPADAVIRAAVEERFGSGISIAIESTGLAGPATVFRQARPDPSALVGKPVRFTLITEKGAAVPVTVVMTVSADHVVASRAIERGATIGRDDIQTVYGPLAGVPMRPLLTASAVAGSKALRRIEAGSIVLRGAVTTRRVVEPGDPVTAVVPGAAVEVTAEFVAADGGEVGALIRVVNPATKRYLRGRIVKEGMVEVTYGR